MNKFDIAFDEPFSQIDVMVDDDVFPRLADGDEPSDTETDEDDEDDETEDEETEDEEVGDEVEKS